MEEAFGAIDEFTPEAVAGVQPLAHRLADLAPDEIADESAILVAAVDAAASGDFSSFEDPSFADADAAVHTFDVATCGYTQVDIRLIDYAFEGDLPTTGGVYSFEVANAGDEFRCSAAATNAWRSRASAMPSGSGTPQSGQRSAPRSRSD